VVTVLCDRAERYFSTKLFGEETSGTVPAQSGQPPCPEDA
jgi:hypothetical protein